MNSKYTYTNKILLYIFPILAIIGITVPILLRQLNLSLLGSYLAIPMIFAPLCYKKCIKNKKSETVIEYNYFKIFLIIFFILFSFSIIVLYANEVRPLSYYIIMSILTTLIIVEILLCNISKNKSKIILAQIMLLMLNIIWGVTLNYYFHISRTDTIAHVWMINNLIEYNHVTDVFELYTFFPLWHILCADLYEILGLSISTQKIMFIANGIVYAFIIPVVYKISNALYKNEKLSLITACLIQIYPAIIIYGMASIPRSCVVFLYSMLILLLLNPENSLTKKILSIFTIFIIILYHTVSTPFILILLLILYILKRIYIADDRKNKDNIALLKSNFSSLNLNYLSLSITLTIAYWMYYSQELLKKLVMSIETPVPSGIITKSIVYTPLNELFNYLQYAPLLFFILVGVFWILDSKDCTPMLKIFCMLGVMSAFISFPGPSLLINKLVADFNIIRFDQYTVLYICIPAAAGIFKIFTISKKKTKSFVIMLFFIMALLSISNDFVASDNPLVKRPFYTNNLYEDEIVAFNHLAEITDGYLMSDYVTFRYLTYSKYESKQHILEVDKNNMSFLTNSSKDIILRRSSELSGRPLKLYASNSNKFTVGLASKETSQEYYYNDSIIWTRLDKYNKVYQSNRVEGFINTSQIW